MPPFEEVAAAVRRACRTTPVGHSPESSRPKTRPRPRPIGHRSACESLRSPRERLPRDRRRAKSCPIPIRVSCCITAIEWISLVTSSPAEALFVGGVRPKRHRRPARRAPLVTRPRSRPCPHYEHRARRRPCDETRRTSHAAFEPRARLDHGSPAHHDQVAVRPHGMGENRLGRIAGAGDGRHAAPQRRQVRGPMLEPRLREPMKVGCM